jgi:hypothetical protein
MISQHCRITLVTHVIGKCPVSLTVARQNITGAYRCGIRREPFAVRLCA